MEHIELRAFDNQKAIGHRDVRHQNTSIQLAVRFTDKQFREIRRLAAVGHMSAAAVVRALIDTALSADSHD